MQTTSNTTKSNSKKLVVFTLLTMLLLSAAAVSMVNAADEDRKIVAPSETPSDGMVPPEEGQLVYALDDNVTALADDSTIHDGQGDLPARNDGPVGTDDNVQAPTVADENATLYTTQDSSLSEEANLIGASQTAPDYTVAILGAVALAAIAACAAVLVARKSKTSAT